MRVGLIPGNSYPSDHLRRLAGPVFFQAYQHVQRLCLSLIRNRKIAQAPYA